MSNERMKAFMLNVDALLSLDQGAIDEAIDQVGRDRVRMLVRLLESVSRVKALESESATLRRELAEARAEVERFKAEARRFYLADGSYVDTDAESVVRMRKEAAVALSEARKESERYREALRAIEAYLPEREPTGPNNAGCEECAARRERQWPPSLLCDEHYREMFRARNRNEAATARQHIHMRAIAREALAASPRETAPAAAPAGQTCGGCVHFVGVNNCRAGTMTVGPDDEACREWAPVAAPHNPQSEE